MDIDRAQAVADHIAVMKDGGRWIFPRSNCVVTFDKQNHTYTMTGGGMDEATVRELDALGWHPPSHTKGGGNHMIRIQGTPHLTQKGGVIT